MRKTSIPSLLVFLAAFGAQAAPAQPSPAAKAAFEKGEKALEAQRYEEAVAAYQDALKATPAYAPALNGMGSALFKLKRQDEAIAKFKAATEADATFKLAWFNLGYSSRKMSDFATAAMAYEKYTALDPQDPDGHYGLAESYKNLGKADKAIAAYETYLKRESRPTEQKWIDRAKESIASLKAAPPAQAAAPAGTPAPSVSPAAAPPAGPAQAPPAASQPTPVAKATPAAPPAGSMPSLAQKKVQEGDRLMAAKQFREASFAYQDAVNADPSNLVAKFMLGNCFASLGYYTQAIERWNEVLQATQDPDMKKRAQDNIGKAQQKLAQSGGGSPQEQGKPPASGPVASETRAKARQFYEQGVQFIGQRRYGEALNALNDCLRLEPALAVGYIARGSTLVGLRRYAEAAVDYQYSLKLDPNLSAPLYGLAEAYRAMNRIDDARQYYQRYVSSAAPDVRADLQSDSRTKLSTLR